jgi:hypothetical protein
MKAQNIKREYIAPAIECFQFDNEISLQLESPPVPGNESSQVLTDFNFFDTNQLTIG